MLFLFLFFYIEGFAVKRMERCVGYKGSEHGGEKSGRESLQKKNVWREGETARERERDSFKRRKRKCGREIIGRVVSKRERKGEKN